MWQCRCELIQKTPQTPQDRSITTPGARGRLAAPPSPSLCLRRARGAGRGPAVAPGGLRPPSADPARTRPSPGLPVCRRAERSWRELCRVSPLPRTGALLVQVSPALVTTCDAAGLWRRRSKWTFRAPVSCAFFLRLYLTLAGACAQAPSGGGVGAGSLRCSGSGIQTAAGPYSGAGTARADEPSMSTSVRSQGRPQ